MSVKWPNTQICQELRGFNREFLDLICAEQSPGDFGLPTPLGHRLRELSVPQLEAIAEMPCLLAGFRALPPTSHSIPKPGPGRVADSPLPPAVGVGTGIGAGAGASVRPDAPERFAAELMTWLWFTARQDRLFATLCFGPDSGAAERLRYPNFRAFQQTVGRDPELLEARFCRHPRLWADLVRSASLGDA